MSAATARLEPAFATFVERGAGALLVGTGSLMFSIGTASSPSPLAMGCRRAMPCARPSSAGGLMSYAPSITDAYRQVGIYADGMFKGERPADLPVMQSIRFELVLNLQTAKTLGLDIPSRRCSRSPMR